MRQLFWGRICTDHPVRGEIRKRIQIRDAQPSAEVTFSPGTLIAFSKEPACPMGLLTVAFQRDLEVSLSSKCLEPRSRRHSWAGLDIHVVFDQSPRKDLSQQPKKIKKKKLGCTLCSRVGGTVPGTVLTRSRQIKSPDRNWGKGMLGLWEPGIDGD